MAQKLSNRGYIKGNILTHKIDGYISSPYEVVERKGMGHPDTLADTLAERLSVTYSAYTLDNFGAVLHHNFDKLSLLGGHSYVAFGKGYLTKPIRIVLSGRASTKFDKHEIPVREILETTAREFLLSEFPMLSEKDFEIVYQLSNASSPGKVNDDAKEEGTRKFWFEPRGLQDLSERRFLASNDTSIGCSYAPLSGLEETTIELERYLNTTYRQENRWLGSDIKIIAFGTSDEIGMTICIPQLSLQTPDIISYRNNIEKVMTDIKNFVTQRDGRRFSLNANMRDNYDTCELYLTVTGSSIESGDEGVVGRGNRMNGIISASRPFSMEAVCGKNPVYHVGKVYNVIANNIARRLYAMTGDYVEVFLISQSGRALKDPWKIIIGMKNGSPDDKTVSDIASEELEKTDKITDAIVRGRITLSPFLHIPSDFDR